MSDGNPYYGGGGGGGGGFMGGGSPYSGSQESPGGKKGRGNQSLRPVTVKQINEASQTHPDSDYQIDGHDINQFVGSVINSATTATNVSYEIGDGTGYIDVRQWLDSADDEMGKMTGIEQDKYVMVTGTIKVFGGKRHVSAQYLRAIEDHNEVFHHLLKSLYVSLSLRNPGGAGGAAPAGATRNDYAATSAAPAGNDFAHLPPLQRKVMEIVAAEDHDDGMHVSMVSRQVGNAGGEEVMDAIENLMAEGLLFSTIDDLHIKAA